ncbi:m7GpppN-mRNA hydrolase-like [Panulirus ornatus]|uniref:m7GpppN-mRNA hydrolase-like n=1 Tax=Panulirus ornatus TaxID=150431 RepID=UPI003A8A0720
MAEFRPHQVLISEEVMDHIYAQFFRDAPESELKDVYRFCYRLQQARWYYIEECAETRQDQKIDLFSFGEQLVSHPQISPPPGDLHSHILYYKEYKTHIPTYGAIMISDDHSQVLLVQAQKSRKWGFPKGKIEDGESPEDCAVREVMEETGYDISGKVDVNHYLERQIGPHTVGLYIIPGVPLDTKFTPGSKWEIRELRWFPLYELPTHKNDWYYQGQHGSSNKFYVARPFIKDIQYWVRRHITNEFERRRQPTV